MAHFIPPLGSLPPAPQITVHMTYIPSTEIPPRGYAMTLAHDLGLRRIQDSLFYTLPSFGSQDRPHSHNSLAQGPVETTRDPLQGGKTL